MSIGTASGAKLYIGTSTTAENLSQFLTETWTEVGEIEDMGEFGDESEEVTFASLSDGRLKKLKGTRDAGTMNLVCGDDISDVGQAALEAAEGSPLDYNIKIVLNDAVTLLGTGSEHYFFAKVMSKRRNVGTANNVVRRTFSLGINSEILSVDPT